MAIGGGVGGLLIIVLALFLGVDPGGVVTQQPMDTRDDAAPGFDLGQCRTGADANKFVQCRVVATGNSVDAVWHQLMRNYTRPHLRLFTGPVNTGCGLATTAVGPFYCPLDQTAYFDTDFFQELVDQIRFQRRPIRAGVRRRPRIRPSRAKPAGHPGPLPAGRAGRRRQRGAHGVAGGLLRRHLGALRVDREAGEHRRARTCNR